MRLEDEGAKQTKSGLEVKLWRAVFVATLVLIALVVIRFATMGRGGSLTVGDPPGGVLARTNFMCAGGKGNVHGQCAESWWEHFWYDLDYCSTIKANCEAGGGTYTTQD
jgi:hypothetical protein